MPLIDPMPRCTSVITVVVAMHVFVVTCSAADIDMFCTESTPLGVLNCSGLVPPSDRDGTSSTPLPRSTAGASMHLRTTSDPLAEDDRSIVLPPIIIQEFQFGPFAAVDLSGSMLEWIPQFSFRNLTTGLLDLSDNRLSLITEDMFSGICVTIIDLRLNQITTIESNAFDGMNLTELNLGQNRIQAIGSLSFYNFYVDVLDLTRNSILNVLPGAWDNMTVRHMFMQLNPTVCHFSTIMSGDNSSNTSSVICDCAYGGTNTWCVQCPSTLHVTNVSWYNVYPEALANESLPTLFAGVDDTPSFSVVTPDFYFHCAGGGTAGQHCVIQCAEDFEGVSVTYECSATTAQWQSTGNFSLPTCVQFAAPKAYSNTTRWMNSSIGDDSIPHYNVATAGEPYYHPPPHAYGGMLWYRVDALPSGLTLAPNGQIVGTPEEAGNFSITIAAMDSYGNLVSATTFVLIVAPPLQVRDSRVIYTFQNVYFVYGEQMVVTGGRPPFRYNIVSGALPPGVSLATGGPKPLVEGYASQVGTWSGIIVAVHDSMGVTRTLPTLTIVVSEAVDEINFRTQFFIALTVSVLLIVVSIILVGRHHQSIRLHGMNAIRKMSDFDADVDKSMHTTSFRHSVKSLDKDTSVMINMDRDTDSCHARGDAPLFGTVHDDDGGGMAGGGPATVTTGTRIFRKDPSATLDPMFLVPLEAFLCKAAFYSNRILVAAPLNDPVLCDAIQDTIDRLARCNPRQPPAELVRIPYWGKFTPPLNVLLRHATINNSEYLLFQSVEVLADRRAIAALLAHMDAHTLVVGLAMDDAHVFLPGHNHLTGLTSPWNTFAIWNVSKLGRTGFLPISDGVPPLSDADAGVEEVAAIALLQMLFPHAAAAKLVRLDPTCYTWDVDFRCATRQRLHRHKMRSKYIRPQVQIGAMGEIERGTVLHIDETAPIAVRHQWLGDGSMVEDWPTDGGDDAPSPPCVRYNSLVVPDMRHILVNNASAEVTANVVL